jgi:hypothetical protein
MIHGKLDTGKAGHDPYSTEGGLLLGGAPAVFAAHISGNPDVTNLQARASEAPETAEPRATPEAPSQTDQDYEHDDISIGSGE